MDYNTSDDTNWIEVTTLAEPILKLEDLKKHYPVRKGLLNRQVATKRVVDGIDLEIPLARPWRWWGSRAAASRCSALRNRAGKTNGGRVLFRGADYAGHEPERDGRHAPQGADDLSGFRRGAASPLHHHGIPGGTVILNGMASRASGSSASWRRCTRWGWTQLLQRYPRSLSAATPARGHCPGAGGAAELILADEPISALDVSLQAQVLNLLMDLKEEFNLSMLFVAHDLAVVRQMADYTLIMIRRQIMEAAPAHEIYDDAQHPYTRCCSSPRPASRRASRARTSIWT